MLMPNELSPAHEIPDDVLAGRVSMPALKLTTTYRSPTPPISREFYTTRAYAYVDKKIEAAPVVVLEADEDVIATVGLRKKIADLILGRSRDSEGRDISSKVRQHTVESVMYGGMPFPELAPVTWRERRLASRTSKLRERIVNDEFRKSRDESLYGGTDQYGRPLYALDDHGNRFNAQKPKFHDETIDLTNIHGETTEIQAKKDKEEGKEAKKLTKKVSVPTLGYSGNRHYEEALDWKGEPSYQLAKNDLGTDEQRDRLWTGRYPRADVKSELRTGQKLQRSEEKAAWVRAKVGIPIARDNNKRWVDPNPAPERTIHDTVSGDSFTSHSKPSSRDKRFVDVSGWM